MVVAAELHVVVMLVEVERPPQHLRVDRHAVILVMIGYLYLIGAVGVGECRQLTVEELAIRVRLGHNLHFLPSLLPCVREHNEIWPGNLYP
jgi:hypothetical protein